MTISNIEHIKKMPGAIFLGLVPLVLKEHSLQPIPHFHDNQYLERTSPLNELHVVQVLDEKGQEHAIAFAKLENLQECIKYFYASSQVIHRRWFIIVENSNVFSNT